MPQTVTGSLARKGGSRLPATQPLSGQGPAQGSRPAPSGAAAGGRVPLGGPAIASARERRAWRALRGGRSLGALGTQPCTKQPCVNTGKYSTFGAEELLFEWLRNKPLARNHTIF